jgi:hypothetical protein
LPAIVMLAARRSWFATPRRGRRSRRKNTGARLRSRRSKHHNRAVEQSNRAHRGIEQRDYGSWMSSGQPGAMWWIRNCRDTKAKRSLLQAPQRSADITVTRLRRTGM